MDFKEMLISARLSINDAALLFCVHKTTIYRWLKTGCPRSVELALSYQLGTAEGWPLFKFTPGQLICPDGTRLPANMLANIEYQFYMARETGWRAKNRPKPPVPVDSNIINFPNLKDLI